MTDHLKKIIFKRNPCGIGLNTPPTGHENDQFLNTILDTKIIWLIMDLPV